MARFGHVECRFDKINDIFSGFWKLGVTAISERWRRYKETNRTGTQAAQDIVSEELLLFFNLYVNVQLVKRDRVTAVIYCYITTEFH